MSGYIGTQPVPQATQTRDSFTATSGQTSFATGGYTPNFLDVYLNGVKLASADYTATNGSDVVLASGAATGDILEVVAFTTFTPADLPAGTPSIDDNGNATALTIDISENVLINGTSTTPWSLSSGSGAVIRSEGYAGFASSSAAIELNRIGSDGNIANFRKNGTTVGSIATQGSRLSIGSGDVNLNFNASANSMYPISDPAAGTLSSGIVDLGAALATFKDAYLSGGIYLGGTGSANKLDDYEEGTWTPATSVGTASSASGTYTKIGRMVVVTGFVSGMNSVNNEVLNIQGLPFTGGNTVQCVGQAMWSNVDKDFGYEQVFYTGGSKFQFYHTTNANFDAIRHVDLDGSNSACYFSATYLV